MGLVETIHEYKFVILVVAFILAIYYIVTRPAVYWFYKPGCPHCDNMKGEIAKVQKDLPNYFKFYVVNTAESKNKKLSDEFNVTGVPHLVKVKDEKKYVYNGKRNASDIMKWIKE